jgi:DNA-binding response OmpR family regulator
LQERRHTIAARLLVVNDTPEILELFRCFLEEEEGYEVVLASFPMQHITEVEYINPDLIILDLVFGDEKTGLQTLQMLKMQRSTAALDVVREQEGYLDSQGVHVVYTPFDLDHLRTNVKQLLESHEHVSSDIKMEREKNK